MAILILLTTSARAGIISSGGFFYSDRFLFNMWRRIVVVVFLAHIFWSAGTAGSARKFFFALAHFAQVSLFFTAFFYPACIGLFHWYGAMTKEAYNIFIHLVVHLLKGTESFDLIN